MKRTTRLLILLAIVCAVGLSGLLYYFNKPLGGYAQPAGPITAYVYYRDTDGGMQVLSQSTFIIPPEAPTYGSLCQLLGGIRLRRCFALWEDDYASPYAVITYPTQDELDPETFTLWQQGSVFPSNPAIQQYHWGGMTQEEWFQAFYDLLRQSVDYME